MKIKMASGNAAIPDQVKDSRIYTEIISSKGKDINTFLVSGGYGVKQGHTYKVRGLT